MAARWESSEIVYAAIMASFDDLAARLRFVRRLISALMTNGQKVMPAKVMLPFQMHQLNQREKDLEKIQDDMQRRLEALREIDKTPRKKRRVKKEKGE